MQQEWSSGQDDSLKEWECALQSFVICWRKLREFEPRFLHHFYARKPEQEQKMIPVNSIILYCSLERQFRDVCIANALRVAKATGGIVLVVTCSHLLTGKVEPRFEYAGAEEGEGILHHLLIEYDDKAKRTNQEWILHFRAEATRRMALKAHLESYTLYLDADEVIDVPRFLAWWKSAWDGHGGGNEKLHSFLPAAFHLNNAWYFRDVRLKACVREDSAVMVEQSKVTPDMFSRIKADREELALLCLGGDAVQLRNIKHSFTALDGEPLIHHFSWVRSLEIVLEKVKAWGHAGERDWESIVREAWAAPLLVKEPIHGYTLVYAVEDPLIALSGA